MELTTLQLPEVKIITPDIFTDFRGYTSVPFDENTASALQFHVVQINQGYSVKPYTLRGLHYQANPHAQAKIVFCLHGSIYNVAVDIRPDSPTYGQHTAEILTDTNHKIMYIPKGFAHGYLTLKPDTLMQWCVDSDFCSESARCLKWDSCGIHWPGNKEKYVISDKDRNGISIDKL